MVILFINEPDRLKRDCFIEIRMIDIEFNKHEQEQFVTYWNKYADQVAITNYTHGLGWDRQNRSVEIL